MTNIKAGIYIIESPTHSIYVGQSRNLKKRFKQYELLHCTDQHRIYNSLKKHGFDKHEITIVQHFLPDCPQEKLNEYEQAYIDLFRNNGYDLMNLREAGAKGRLSEESKARISKSNKGKHTKLGKENSFYGKKHTEETKKKLSEHRKTIKLTPEHKEKLHAARRGKPAWNSGKKLQLTPEQSQKHIDAWLGKKHKPETIQKMKEYWRKKREGAL